MTESGSRGQGKRQRVDTTPGKAGGSRFMRRDEKGRFTSYQVDTGRSVAQDRRRHAEHSAGKGMNDRGD